jgi:hypothetical protein
MPVRWASITVSALVLAALVWPAPRPRPRPVDVPGASATPPAASTTSGQSPTTGQSRGASAQQQLFDCVATPPATPLGTFESATIPGNVSTDLRRAPASTITFERTHLLTNMIYAYGIAVADYDCDGRWDVSLFDSYVSTLRRPLGVLGYVSYRGNAPTSITPLDTWPELNRVPGLYLFERHVAMDINGDNLLDIVGVANTHAAIVAYLNPGPGAPAVPWPRRYLSVTVPAPINLVARDMDGDGLTDLVVAMRIQPSTDPNPEIRGLVWLKNPGPESQDIWARHVIEPSSDLMDPRNLQVADFDRDGRPDVYVSDSSTGVVSTFLQTAPAQWQRHDVYVTAIHGHYGATVDEDADGVPEIIQPTYLGMRLLKFDAATKTWTPRQIAFYVNEETLVITGDVAVADMDGDGFSDIVFSIVSLARNATLPRRGGIYMMRRSQNWRIEAVVHTTHSVVEIRLADMNADGLVDIVANAEYPLNAVSIYYQRRMPPWWG